MQTRIYHDALQMGGGTQLYYNILCDFGGRCPAYGAEIILESAEKYESAAICGLTTSRGRMEQIVTVLRSRSVRPCAMREAVEEALGRI